MCNDNVIIIILCINNINDNIINIIIIIINGNINVYY